MHKNKACKLYQITRKPPKAVGNLLIDVSPNGGMRASRPAFLDLVSFCIDLLTKNNADDKM